MSQSAFFDCGIRGESNQLVPVNLFRHSPVYLRHFHLFSSLIFLPSQFWDVNLDAFFSLLVSGSHLTPHGFILKSWLKSSQKAGGLKLAQKLQQRETAVLLDQVDGFGFCSP